VDPTGLTALEIALEGYEKLFRTHFSKRPPGARADTLMIIRALLDTPSAVISETAWLHATGAARSLLESALHTAEYRISRDGHAMQSHYALKNTWERLRQKVPDDLRHGLSFNVENRTWTYTDTAENIRNPLPLRIGNAPVITSLIPDPVFSIGGSSSLRDPLGGPFNHFKTSKATPHQVAQSIFQTYCDALGFYVLFSGQLQIVLTPGTDVEWQVSNTPSVFAGMPVSFFLSPRCIQRPHLLAHHCHPGCEPPAAPHHSREHPPPPDAHLQASWTFSVPAGSASSRTDA